MGPNMVDLHTGLCELLSLGNSMCNDLRLGLNNVRRTCIKTQTIRSHFQYKRKTGNG